MTPQAFIAHWQDKDITERVPEVVPGYPDRILPKLGHEADLKSAH